MENAHCRLCAELKPLNKLIDLQSEADKRIDIVRKLARLNARTVVLFTEEVLPKTVCFVCLGSLDRAFEFIQTVEHAQDMLNSMLLRQVKKEEVTDDSDRGEAFLDDQSESIMNNIKVKLEILENDPVSLSREQDEQKRKKRVKPAKCRSFDSIPLSQLKLTWKEYSWSCSYCEAHFKSADELKTHSMQYHHCCNAFKCGDCNIKKLKLDSFLVHIKRHRRNLKLSCHVCHENFAKQSQMNNHKGEHITTEHICKGCNTCFPNLEELNEHTSLFFRDKRATTMPMKNSFDLTCVLCKKVFKARGSLNSHLLTHTDRKRDHTCEKCGKCFFNKQNLAGHMLLHDDTRPYKCKICKFGFKTLGQLRNHVGVHDGVKPYSCDQCGRCFRLPKQLKSHQIIHTDELPYICSYCGKSFRFKTILNQHVRQHTGLKPYSCELCSRDFTNWPNYNKHMKRRHGMDMAKKKHTPEGLYPINPATGEVVIVPETIETVEWKREMLKQRRPGRPKQSEIEMVEMEPMNFKCEVTIESQNEPLLGEERS